MKSRKQIIRYMTPSNWAKLTGNEGKFQRFVCICGKNVRTVKHYLHNLKITQTVVQFSVKINLPHSKCYDLFWHVCWKPFRICFYGAVVCGCAFAGMFILSIRKSHNARIEIIVLIYIFGTADVRVLELYSTRLYEYQFFGVNIFNDHDISKC